MIVGLGNPGPQYQSTRHNVGFMVLDRLREDSGSVAEFKQKGKGLLVSAFVAGENRYLLKPQTFMNLSGESVAEIARFFKIDVSEILVVYDEIDLPFATLRLKKGGGDGGHNGIKSVAARLGSRDFTRLRVGIGRPEQEQQSVSSWVLSSFDAEEASELPFLLKRSVEAVDTLCREGLKVAQNTFN